MYAVYVKSKTYLWNAFVKTRGSVLPSEGVLKSCEEFIFNLLSPKEMYFRPASALLLHYLQGLNIKQGTDKLPPTKGAILEHVRKTHLQ